MSDINNPKSQKLSKPAAAAPPPESTTPSAIPPLFRRIDWLTALIAFAVIWVIYFLTMAPELTLEDSGELVTGSVYAGIPHPPGYPVWTLYTWLWTVLVPWGNMAWRVTLGEFTAAAFGCGLLALMVSRGSSMLMEGIEELKSMTGKWEGAICMVSGIVASLLMALDGFVWSESVVINRISLFGMPWLMIVLVCLLRWIYAPNQMRYLYFAMFGFGICATIHQTLVCAAMGIEVAVIAVRPKLGRDLLVGNTLVYIFGIVAKAMHLSVTWDNAGSMVMLIFHVVGALSIVGSIWLIIKTNGVGTYWKSAFIMLALWALGASFYLYMPIAGMSNPPMQWGYPRTVEGFFHALTRGQYEKVNPTDIINDPLRFFTEMRMLVGGIITEFNLVYVLIALLPFLFFFKMQKRERAWIITLSSIYACIGVLLMMLLNPNVDRASAELIRVFFASSHGIVAIMVGYGLALTAAYMATNYERFRRWGVAGGVTAVVLALYVLLDSTGTLYGGLAGTISLSQLPQYVAQSFAKNQYGLPVFAGLVLVALGLVFVMALVVYRKRAPLAITLGVFALMPLHPGLAHWFDSEQRGHMFGYWFGHDMFTPPFKGADNKPIYPEMTKDAVLFGGTDPGRFCPTYMVFCESFTPHNCQPAEDQKFDRRDVYVITQNALADGTYLCYIRAHYNRSKQIDPPFFQELLHTSMVSPLDTAFTRLGARIEKRRRTYTSWFAEKDFTNFPALVAKLRPSANQDALSKWIWDNLSKETQQLMGTQSEGAARTALAQDLNKLIEREFEAHNKLQDLAQKKDALDLKAAVITSDSVRREQEEVTKEIATLSKVEPLYTPARFAKVNVSHYLTKFIAENPQSYTRIRLNRMLLEEAYPAEIAKSLGGIYPDREIYIPTPDDSTRCFQEYMADAQRRKMMNPPQLKPGEVVEIVGDHVQVSGQTAVMSINGLLTKVIFDNNPENEFYVEESFPLDWMYPYLMPYGVIMKINRTPMASLSEDMLQKDHEFWNQYSKRFIGDWITYDTSVKQVTDWIEKTYLHHNFEGFTGDRKFVRDTDAQKAFSKLRSSIASSIYFWRLNPQCPAEYRPKTPAETQRLLKEANFAFMQAFAFCPYSPEAVYHYCNLLTQFNRWDDAFLVLETCQKLDPFNTSISGWLENLRSIHQQMLQGQPASGNDAQEAIQKLEESVRKNPNDFQATLVLADAYSQMQQPQRSLQLLDTVLNSTNKDPNIVIAAVQGYVKLQNWPKAEQALQKLTLLTPENPEAWYDLAVLRATLNKPDDAMKALSSAMDLNDKRRQHDPNARDLRADVRKEARFSAMRQRPDFQKLVPDAK